jgi:SAM-dependent methyltransferase
MVERIKALGCPQPVVVELCSGDGRLAREVLSAVPDATYVGIDASRSLGDYVERKLGAEVICADLSEAGWPDRIGAHVDVICTLQSMHDVGDGSVISQIYRSCMDALSPGGFFLVADFVVTEETFDAEKPGRLPVAWHLKALTDAGFGDAVCSLESGAIGCMVGMKSDS